ncbi:hypothetical protein MWU65_13170 [Cellulophaga sp. F20128]|uniref:hypothetical protein n=1 Tax=Cellulophaga sp. F20128 TaxID=2926413 RepID=UPI001FF1EA8C|nr:hypothetical protein [Cellulophaga sp. F20128]MCK0158138.1 hypothetical protein [Cellulophaga sp. F20128]
MRINKNSVFLIGIFSIYYLIYVFLIPSYENPDETAHYKNTYNVASAFSISGDGGSYYNVHLYFAKIIGLDYQEFDIDLKKNSNFSYFGNEYRYGHNAIFPSSNIVFHRLLNLLFIIPFFFLFLKHKENRVLFSLSLCVPGFVWFMSNLNPDVLNILVGIIFFSNKEKHFFKVFVFMLLSFFFLDRTIILLIATFFIYSLYNIFPKIKKLSFFLFCIFLGSCFWLTYNIGKNIISVPNFELEPIKSLFTVLVSFYGLLGNMSIRATLLEYGLFFIIVFLVIIKSFFLNKEHNSYYEIGYWVRFVIIYFILWFCILTLAPTLDQGRFFYPIIFPILYLFNKLVVKNNVELSTKVLMASIVLNGLMFVKLIYIYIQK